MDPELDVFRVRTCCLMIQHLPTGHPNMANRLRQGSNLQPPVFKSMQCIRRSTVELRNDPSDDLLTPPTRLAYSRCLLMTSTLHRTDVCLLVVWPVQALPLAHGFYCLACMLPNNVRHPLSDAFRSHFQRSFLPRFR